MDSETPKTNISAEIPIPRLFMITYILISESKNEFLDYNIFSFQKLKINYKQVEYRRNVI